MWGKKKTRGPHLGLAKSIYYFVQIILCFEITELTLGFVPLGKGQGEVRAPAEGERRFGYDGHGTTGADRYL